MAKKSGSSPLLIGAVIIIGAIASIPKEVWVLLLVPGGVVFVAWLAKNLLGGKSSSESPRESLAAPPFAV